MNVEESRAQSLNALARLNAVGCWDYRIQRFDGSRLVIVGSTNLCYYHLVEAEFFEVYYVGCPTLFSDAVFRIATEAERMKIAPLVAIDEEETLFAIDAESSGSLKKQTFFILALSVRITEARVNYGVSSNEKETGA